MSVNENECSFAGLDPTKVASIARRIGAAAKEARAMGLTVFGGSGTGTLRWHGENTTDYRLGALIVAKIDGGSWDGGDGAEHTDEHGLTRGEDG